jgi:hypothetical protein
MLQSLLLILLMFNNAVKQAQIVPQNEITEVGINQPIATPDPVVIEPVAQVYEVSDLKDFKVPASYVRTPSLSDICFASMNTYEGCPVPVSYTR